jgi:hypothetical protein
MPVELAKLFDQIRQNKKQGTGFCSNCALQKDHGPVLIDCTDDALRRPPKIVVVSESPVSKRGKLLGDINAWTTDLMTQCSESLGELSSAGTMGKFIGRLSRGRVYSKTDMTRTRGLYWTHAVKCFLQTEENKEMPFRDQIKKNRGSDFHSAIRECSKYLPEEIRCIGPELIIAVGTSVAGRKLVELGLHEKLCVVYHPGAQLPKQQKQEKLNALCKRVRDLGLTDALPACV